MGLQLLEVHGVFTLQDMRQMRHAHENLETQVTCLHNGIVAQVSANAVTNYDFLMSGMSCYWLGVAKSWVNDGLEVDRAIFLRDVALHVTDISPCQRLSMQTQNEESTLTRKICRTQSK